MALLLEVALFLESGEWLLFLILNGSYLLDIAPLMILALVRRWTVTTMDLQRPEPFTSSRSSTLDPLVLYFLHVLPVSVQVVGRMFLSLNPRSPMVKTLTTLFAQGNIHNIRAFLDVLLVANLISTALVLYLTWQSVKAFRTITSSHWSK